MDAFPGSSTVTFGLQVLGNGSDTVSIEFVSVTPVLGTPEAEVLGEAKFLGPDRVEELGYGSFDVLPGWPAVDVPHMEVRGQTLPPGSGHFEVVVPVGVPESGMAIIEGFDVNYRAGGRSYRARTSTTLVLCPAEDPRECREFEAGM